MADYLEAYAGRFDLPVRTGVHVERISREGDRYVVSLADARIEADHVIVASGADRDPRIPAFSRELDPAIVQMHSSAYRNPSQLREGGVLVVAPATPAPTSRSTSSARTRRGCPGPIAGTSR